MTVLKHAICAMAVLLMSCHGGNVSERVSSAEMAFAAEDVASARRLCDELVGEHNAGNTIAAIELARLSILYMQLYDRTDKADALSLAADCYKEAYEENADSADYFYSHLPVEQEKFGMSLSMLVHSMEHKVDLSDGQPETDSIDVN